MIAVANRKQAVDHLVDDLHMSVSEAARELGLPRTTVASWRRGSGRPADHPCPVCQIAMREPAACCGFCEAEAKEAA